MATKTVKPTKKADKPATKKPATQQTPQKKPAVKPAAEPPKPQVTVEKEMTSYKYGVVRAVRFDVDDDGHFGRWVREYSICGTEDLTNDPKKVEELRDATIDKVCKEEPEFFLHDEAAYEDFLKDLEHNIGELALRVEYGNKCKRCTVHDLENFREYARSAREFMEERRELVCRYENVPDVLPSKKDALKFEGDKCIDLADQFSKSTIKLGQITIPGPAGAQIAKELKK